MKKHSMLPDGIYRYVKQQSVTAITGERNFQRVPKSRSNLT